VSVASFLPILIVAPISDIVGTTAVIFILAIAVLVIGILSVVTRGPLQATEARPASDPDAVDPIATALGADRPPRPERPVRHDRVTQLDGSGIPVEDAAFEDAAFADVIGPADPTDRA
jgi:hypothetical protein